VAEEEKEGDHVDLRGGHVAGVEERGAGADFEGNADEVVEGENDDAEEGGADEAEKLHAAAGAFTGEGHGEDEGEKEEAVEFTEAVFGPDGVKYAGEEDESEAGGEKEFRAFELYPAAEGENQSPNPGDVEGHLAEGVADRQENEAETEEVGQGDGFGRAGEGGHGGER
jgi:hypothetical protein